MIKAVIFDLDGVVVTTDEYHYQGWKRIADELGLPFDREKNNLLRGVSRMESLEILLGEAKDRFSPEEKTALAERKNACYRALLEELTPADILPGVRELLAALKEQNVMTAIGSSSKNAGTILRYIGLADAFDAVVDGTCISRSKPDPEVFVKAAQALGTQPQESMVIEDAVAGIRAAKAAGMYAVAVGDAKTCSLCDHRAEELTEVIGLIADLNSGRKES